jgi:hypothetical protein
MAIPYRETATYKNKKEKEKSYLAHKGNIKDFDKCPYCGSVCNLYYTKEILHGTSTTYYSFKTHDLDDNNTMYDNIECVWNSKFYYCYDCDSPICKV